MALVDLRGRQDEPAVRALLACAHGSAASADRAAARYRSGEWVLIGWEDGSALVACAGVERVASDEIAMRSVAVARERRRQGNGRALVDAVAGAATARRLVAETDEDAVGFYRSCGFSTERIEPTAGRARFRCARTIEPRAGSAVGVSALTLGDLERAIEESWGRDTSDDPEEWSEDNPARGQCAVTSVLVRDLLGGEILIAGVLRGGERVERHAWNRLASGLSVDLTRSQFRSGEELEEPEPGGPILADRVRCELFAERVLARLGAAT